MLLLMLGPLGLSLDKTQREVDSHTNSGIHLRRNNGIPQLMSCFLHSIWTAEQTSTVMVHFKRVPSSVINSEKISNFFSIEVDTAKRHL